MLVVAAYGLILPQAVLDLPRRGCLNIHASLLPRWRGAAPIQRAIAAGDAQTGITIMQMDAGLDTGPMLSAASTHNRTGRYGSEPARQTGETGRGRRSSPHWLDWKPAICRATPQPDHGATYAAKLDKAEAELDLRQPAEVLERLVRAFNPFPVRSCVIGDAPVKIWRAALVRASGEPGEVLASGPSGIVVACGERALSLLELQKPGGKRLAAREFLAGFPVPAGSRFSGSAG